MISIIYDAVIFYKTFNSKYDLKAYFKKYRA